MSAEHVCDATVPVCSCGHAWGYVRRWSGGDTTYSDATLVERYRALYGEPQVPFERLEVARG